MSALVNKGANNVLQDLTHNAIISVVGYNNTDIVPELHLP